MKRKSDKPLSKHTLNLYVGQMDKLNELHPRLGAALVIRKLIDKHIGDVEGKAASVAPEPPALDATIEELT